MQQRCRVVVLNPSALGLQSMHQQLPLVPLAPTPTYRHSIDNYVHLWKYSSRIQGAWLQRNRPLLRLLRLAPESSVAAALFRLVHMMTLAQAEGWMLSRRILQRHQ